jgi:hypothetical protein
VEKDGRAPEVRVVEAWHDALNSGDVERLVSLSHPAIEIIGPRGRGIDEQLIRDWAGRTGISLKPQRVFYKADTVITEQAAEWRSAESGEMTGNQTVASVFIVRDEQVVSVARHDEPAEALDSASLSHSDEI